MSDRLGFIDCSVNNEVESHLGIDTTVDKTRSLIGADSIEPQDSVNTNKEGFSTVKLQVAPNKAFLTKKRAAEENSKLVYINKSKSKIVSVDTSPTRTPAKKSKNKSAKLSPNVITKKVTR